MTVDDALEWADEIKEEQDLYGIITIVDTNRHIDILAAEVRRLREFVEQEETAADGWQKRAEAAEKEIELLKRGEYICKRCGLRKDDEHEKGDF